MIPNPIRKVLSILSTHQVRYLLMGGQACVLYGAAEFSRDCDVAILCDDPNLAKLQEALLELEAEPIAVPPFEPEYLERGHVVHFRCHARHVEQMRLDVMSKMRGVDSFEELWDRRTILDQDASVRIELMSLPDLVAAKKTQQDKDWPMIRRLIEANYAAHRESPTDEQILFWLSESRTPQILIELAAQHLTAVSMVAKSRPLLRDIGSSTVAEIEQSMADEQQQEREADRRYWDPLKKELEMLRRNRP